METQQSTTVCPSPYQIWAMMHSFVVYWQKEEEIGALVMFLCEQRSLQRWLSVCSTLVVCMGVVTPVQSVEMLHTAVNFGFNLNWSLPISSNRSLIPEWIKQCDLYHCHSTMNEEVYEFVMKSTITGVMSKPSNLCQVVEIIVFVLMSDELLLFVLYFSFNWSQQTIPFWFSMHVSFTERSPTCQRPL